MNPSMILGLGTAMLLVAPAGLAQQSDGGIASISPRALQGFQSWNESDGTNWHRYDDPRTGYARFLFGGQAAPAFQPVGDADYFSLGRLAIESTEAMHGIESGTLVESRTTLLPLSRVGTNDKVTVQFRQEVGGVPVLGGYVNTLFTPEGQLLSVQTTAMPGLAGFSTDALVDGRRAATIALRTFEERVGLPGTLMGDPRKAIGQLETSPRSREARLIWEVEVMWKQPDVEPEGFTYWIDAVDASLLRAETMIHHLYDVGGTINTMATPGTLPDQAGNPAQSLPMNHARVNGGGAGTVYTDADGNFNFPGVTGPINITVDYYGPWADVDNVLGADYSLSASINGTGNSVLMNPASAALITSQANAFRTIGLLRDYVRGVAPGDSTADFRALANVNIDGICSAYFDGSSVNFSKAGYGCASSAYSTTITHEMGHWLNVLYGTGNGSDGMGEGNADVWAMYQWDTPYLFEDFVGPGTGPGRSGENTTQFCGDDNPGCHGGAHADGEVWMGAAWKVRRNLNNTLGDAAGDAIADHLFIGWLNAYDQTEIKSVIEIQWLTLDDDNGNIDDGTPNYLDIDAAFREQGFPGYDVCFDPVKYGTNKDNSLGRVAQITWSGTPSETSGDFQIGLNGGIPDQFALLFSGGTAVSVPFFGGLRLVGNPLNREAFVQLDGSGSTMVPMAVDPGSSGSEEYFQFWYRDPAHPDGTDVGLSDGLEVLYCD